MPVVSGQESVRMWSRRMGVCLLAAGRGDAVVGVEVDTQAVVARVVLHDRLRADGVDQSGTALARQALERGLVRRLTRRPAKRAIAAAPAALHLGAGGADAGRQGEGGACQQEGLE